MGDETETFSVVAPTKSDWWEYRIDASDPHPGCVVAWCVDRPGIRTQASTANEAVASLREIRARVLEILP